MIRPAGFALLVAASALLGWGCGDSGSMRLDFSQFLWGIPTDRIAWLFLGGTTALAMSLGLLFPNRIQKRGPPRRRRNDSSVPAYVAPSFLMHTEEP